MPNKVKIYPRIQLNIQRISTNLSYNTQIFNSSTCVRDAYANTGFRPMLVYTSRSSLAVSKLS